MIPNHLTIVLLADVPYLDFPELKFNDHESTQMPFRYVKGEDGNPIMPKVSPVPSEGQTVRKPD
jgi:ribosome biogenesis SPOUT family RNA methylase Rps3